MSWEEAMWSSWYLRKNENVRPNVIEHAGMQWEVLPGGEEIVRSLPDWTFATLCKDFNSAQIRKMRDERFVFRMQTPSQDVIVKSQLSIGYKPLARSLYNRSKGRKEWQNLLVAFDRGFPVARPIAFGELKRWMAVRESVVISEWLANASTVRSWRQQKLEEGEDDATLEPAAELGRLTARMHRIGLYHNELHDRNVLVENAEEGPRIVIVDWKHARIKLQSTRNDLRNLLRTGSYYARQAPGGPATDAEKRAFLKAYLEERADRPGRGKLVNMLRERCPDAAWIDREFDV